MSTVGQEAIRQDTVRQDIVSAAHELAALGLSPGRTGNVSVRIGDEVHIAPTGCDLSRLTVDQLAVTDLGGRTLSGPKPSKELPLHLAFYRRSDSCTAVVHLHSRQATAASCLPPWSPWSAIGPISPYFVMRVGQAPLVPYAPPGDPRQAADLLALELPFRAALLQNHGPVVSGRTVREAVEAAVEIEEASALTLLTRATDPHLLSPADARELADRYGSPWTAGAR
ncbi:class II aldolase/adducin family protein [Streptomyces sp. NPDC059398]|uniref:class II aldolase/adducin family protein n=1 Tax=Streptomyces sp. NPDC059398 TaxID=3346820 RepID=UPI0036C72C80